MFSYTEPREAILDYGQWLLRRQGDWFAAARTAGKRHGKTVIVQFDGVADRDEAAGFIGCDIAVERDDMPVPAEGSYYWSDLEGLTVVHRDGTPLGTVAELIETGANDVLVVTGDRERLIPFVAGTVVLDVDLAAGRMCVDWEWD